MSILRVMLNKLSSDWQVARAVLEDEYKGVDTTSNKIRTRYEFVAHLLDVHRMSCEVCLNPACPGALGVAVRSDRDTAVSVRGSAARLGQRMYVTASTQTDGLHSYAPNMGLLPGNDDDGNINISDVAFPLAMTFNGEDEELQVDVNTSTEKPSKNERGIKQEDHDESIREKDTDTEQREEGAEDGWIDDGTRRPSSVQDIQSNLERTNQLSYLLIKEEGDSQEYCDMDVNNITCESASHHTPEEAIPTQDNRSDLLYHLDRPIQLSNLHIKQEGAFQEHCDVDMDDSRNEATSQQRPEEVIPTQLIGSDEKSILDKINEPSTSTHSYDVCSTEGSSQETCDTDWKTAVDKIIVPSGSPPSRGVRSSERSSLDMLLPYMNTSKTVQNTSRSDGRKPFQCSSCSKKYSCKRAFHEHLRTHSDIYKKVQSTSRCEPKPQVTGVKPHQCSVCSRKFNYKGDMIRHMRLHTGERLYQCSVCAKTFARKGHLQYHMRLHTGERPYKCSMCDKTFVTKNHLSCHMRTHTGEKPYECSVCSKKFTRNHDLIRHTILHTGEKPHQCLVCSKRFSQTGNLKSHMRTHTVERPYQCSVCDETFIKKSLLSHHVREHTGEKPYECSVCSKRFTRNHDLMRHMILHTGEKPHQCSVCSKRFSQTGNLKSHMRTHIKKGHINVQFVVEDLVDQGI